MKGSDIHIPSFKEWNTAYHFLELTIDKWANENKSARPEAIGSVEDLLNDRCSYCHGVLFRIDFQRLPTKDVVFMSGTITCPSQYLKEDHPKEVWLEIWHWPEGKKYLDFLENHPRGHFGPGAYEEEYKRDPFADLFIHSDPKIPICYDGTNLSMSALGTFALFKLYGHEQPFNFPSHLHKPPKAAGIMPHPLRDENAQVLARQIIKDHSKKFEAAVE